MLIDEAKQILGLDRTDYTVRNNEELNRLKKAALVKLRRSSADQREYEKTAGRVNEAYLTLKAEYVGTPSEIPDSYEADAKRYAERRARGEREHEERERRRWQDEGDDGEGPSSAKRARVPSPEPDCITLSSDSASDKEDFATGGTENNNADSDEFDPTWFDPTQPSTSAAAGRSARATTSTPRAHHHYTAFEVAALILHGVKVMQASGKSQHHARRSPQAAAFWANVVVENCPSLNTLSCEAKAKKFKNTLQKSPVAVYKLVKAQYPAVLRGDQTAFSSEVIAALEKRLVDTRAEETVSSDE